MYEPFNPPVAFLMSAMFGFNSPASRLPINWFTILNKRAIQYLKAALRGSRFQLFGSESQLLQHHRRIVRRVAQLAQVIALSFGAGQRHIQQRLGQLRRA